MNEPGVVKKGEADAEAARSPTRARTGPRSWSCFKVDGERSERLSAATAQGVEVSTWPISELSFDVIRARWGTGAFRVQYLDERGQPCGRKLVKLTERPTAPKARRIKVAAPTPAPLAPAESVQAVVALMGVAQSQANMLVNQVRSDAQRTVEREREFMALAMKYQETLFAEMDRQRREAAASRPVDAGQDAVLGALRDIASKLDGDEEPGDSSAPEPLWQGILRDLAPHCAPGVNALLAAAAPGVGALVAAMAARATPVTRDATEPLAVAPDAEPPRAFPSPKPSEGA